MQRRAIAEIVAVISAAYPNWNPTEQTPEVYWQTLRDIPEDELKAAVLQCITEGGRKFAPSVGEIRGAVQDIRAVQRGLPSGYEAWNEVLHAPRDGKGIKCWEQDGKYFVQEWEYRWSSPLVLRAAHLLGWPRFPDGENMTADRSRYLECYNGLIEKAMREDMRLVEVRQYIEAHKVKQLEEQT